MAHDLAHNLIIYKYNELPSSFVKLGSDNYISNNGYWDACETLGVLPGKKGQARWTMAWEKFKRKTPYAYTQLHDDPQHEAPKLIKKKS